MQPRIAQDMLDLAATAKEKLSTMLPISPVTGNLLTQLRTLIDKVHTYVRVTEFDASMVGTLPASILIERYTANRQPRTDSIELIFDLVVRCGSCFALNPVKMQGGVTEEMLQALVPRAHHGASLKSTLRVEDKMHPMFDPNDDIARRAALFRAFGPARARDRGIQPVETEPRNTEESMVIAAFNMLLPSMNSATCQQCKRNILFGGGAVFTPAGYVGDSVSPWYGKAHTLEMLIVEVTRVLTSSSTTDAEKVAEAVKRIECTLQLTSAREQITDEFELACFSLLRRESPLNYAQSVLGVQRRVFDNFPRMKKS